MQKFFNKLTSAKNLERLEYFAVMLGLILFFVHLILIAFGRYTPWLSWLSVDTSFLAALQTPLTVILYYEVLLLILAFPRPLIYSMGKQYEIATLLAVRDVFKLVSAADISTGSSSLNPSNILTLILTLGSSVLMFAVLFLFYQYGKHYSADQTESVNFIILKKILSLTFATILITLVLFDTFNFFTNPILNNQNQIIFPDFHHYRYILLWMIFADVVVFMLSLLHVTAYRSLFLYSLFIVTTVLIRISLLIEPPFSQLINLISIIAGTTVLWTFNKYRQSEVGG